MTRNPAPGELRGCPQDVRSRVEPYQGVPAIEKKDALFTPGLAFRGHVQKKRSIVCSKQRFAREIPGRRLRISDRMTAREHELHGFGPSRCLPPSEPILVNKSLPRRWPEWPAAKAPRAAPPHQRRHSSNRLKLLEILVEARGFEPPIPSLPGGGETLKTLNYFANWRILPLLKTHRFSIRL